MYSSRNWHLIVYGIENFEEYIDARSKYLKHYISIFHCFDDCEPHWHLCVNLLRGYEFDFVRKIFSCGENVIAKDNSDYKSRFDIVPYFLHKDSKSRSDGKFEYDMSMIYSDDISYWIKEDISSDNSRYKRRELYDDLLLYYKGSMSKRDLYIKYGRDIIIHWDKYIEFLNECLHDYRESKL